MKKNRLLSVFMAALLVVSAVPHSQSQPMERYNASGDRIVDYFDVHAADLKSVLRQLSAYSGVDIIPSEAAKATVSITVSNKSWREILGIICLVHSLTAVQEQSFVYVMGKEEAAARGAAAAAAAAASGDPSAAGALTMLMPKEDPLVREVIQLRFTTAAEMSPAITPFLTQRGKLTPVQHTNALIVVDTDENLRELRKLVDQIDIQTAQVSISCKIIEVSSGVVQQIGTSWGGTANNDFAVINHDDYRLGASQNGGLDGMHKVTLGVLSPKDLRVTLDYLFRDSKAEVVAQPQITTLNNKEAKVFMGEQIPINTKDEAGNTVTQMVNAGTQLTVTPYVAGDGKIMLSLNPKKESYTITDGTPVISEQSAVTNVLVNNGETVVIAGLTKNEKQEAESGIPFLKNIPIIGFLFKRSSKMVDKKDLVIFVTPHIIHSGL